MKRIFLNTLIASVAFSSILGIIVILIGNFGEFEMKVLSSTFSIACASILGLACGAAYEAGRGKMLPLAGIGFAVVSGLSFLLIIWGREPESEYLVKAIMSATIIAVALAHLSLVSLATLDSRFQWAPVAVQAAVASLSFLVLILIWVTDSVESDLYFRVLGVLSIVVAALTIMIPVFHKLSDVPQEPAAGESPDSRRAAIDGEISELRARIEELEKEREELDQGDAGVDRES